MYRVQVWISPVVQNINTTKNKLGEAYHGYWTQDINQLNSHFGSEADLKSLVDTAHQKNMYIMVDVVSTTFAMFLKAILDIDVVAYRL
jgi:alpha-amylase